MIKNDKHVLIFNGATIFIFVVLLVVLFYKVPFGFVSIDEAFFLSIPHRLDLGDSLIINEWHPAQFSGLLLYPIFMIYNRVFGSYEGIVLFIRILYVILHLLVTLFLFVRLRKYGLISLCIILVYGLYTRTNIMSITYNTIGLSCFLMFALLMFEPRFKNRKLELVISGVCFAIGVLCVPTMAIAYFIATGIIVWKYNKNKYLFNEWCYFTLGVIFSAFIVISFMLSRASLNDLITYFPKLFISDPTHDMTLIGMIKKTIYFMYQAFSLNSISMISIGLFAVMFVRFLFDKNRQNKRIQYFLLSMIFTFGIMIAFSETFRTDFIMFSFTPIGLVAFMMSNKKNNRLFYIYLFGLIFALLANLSSDTNFNSVSCSSTISSIASIVLCLNLIKEISTNKNRKVLIALFTILIVTQCGIELKNKLNGIYDDAKISKLNEIIEFGPAKGIRTTEKYKLEYNGIVNEISNIHNSEVLIFTNKAWAYLALDNTNRYSTYSTWLPTHSKIHLDLVYDYYRMGQNDLPSVIYIPKSDLYDYFNIEFDSKKYGYEVSKLDFGILLEKIK